MPATHGQAGSIIVPDDGHLSAYVQAIQALESLLCVVLTSRSQPFYPWLQENHPPHPAKSSHVAIDVSM
jgi:hypothetical protein